MDANFDPTIVRKSQFVELVVAGVAGGNTQTHVQFTPQVYLQGKPTFFIEAYTGNDVTISPLGNAVATVAQFKLATLTLYMSDPDDPKSFGNWVQNMSLWDLHRIQNGTDPYVKELFKMAGPYITWEKSYIDLSSALANTTNVSFLFNVGYRF